MDDLGDIIGSLIEVVVECFSDLIVGILSLLPAWVNITILTALVSLITWLCLR